MLESITFEDVSTLKLFPLCLYFPWIAALQSIQPKQLLQIQPLVFDEVDTEIVS